MKKKRNILVTCMLMIATVVMIFSACSGSKFAAIKSSYEEAGYTESESLKEYQSQIEAAMDEEYEKSCTVHLFTKANGLLDMGVAIIFEFTTTKAMEDAVNGSETLKGLLKDLDNAGILDDLQKSDYVNGNCVLILALGSDTVSTFANA